MLSTNAEGRPATEFTFTVFLWLYARAVGGMSDVDGNGGIWFEVLGVHPRPGPSDFLLHRAAGHDAATWFCFRLRRHSQRFYCRPCSHAVIEGPGCAHVIVEHLELVDERDGIAHSDSVLRILSVLCAYVYEAFVHFWRLGFFGAVAKVYRRCPNHAAHDAVGGMNVHPLVSNQRGVDSAYSLEPDEAFLVDMLDHQAQFVGVSIEHDSRVAVGVENGYGVAVSVGSHLVGELACIFAPYLLTRGFISARGGGGEQLLEKLQ